MSIPRNKLKNALIPVLASAALFGVMSSAHALDTAAAVALAGKGACVACHSAERKMVGPAYKDIAKKYAGDTSTPDRLAKKIRNGGSGVWGSLPMPPQATLTDAEIGTLVEWVLAGAPPK
jgi:cytochrome c